MEERAKESKSSGQRGKDKKTRATRSDKGKARTPYVRSVQRTAASAAMRKRLAKAFPAGLDLDMVLTPRRTQKTRRLPSTIKHLIVRMNGARMTPSEVSIFIKEITGIEITRQDVEYYDPTKRAGRNLSPKWHEIFFEARSRSDERANNIHLTSYAYRMAKLQQLLDLVMSSPSGNTDLARKIILLADKMDHQYRVRKAAKEEHSRAIVASLTPEEKASRFLAVVKEVFGIGATHLKETPNACPEQVTQNEECRKSYV